jgi:hypothetical protein
MGKGALVLTLALLALANPAHAAKSKDGRCYTPAEVQAEQLLRLHSELMVITVTCRQSSTGQDLVTAYTGFTRNNINVLRDAEQTMTGYFKKTYGGKGVDRLDKLRTTLANEYGQEIANVSAPVFCAQRRDRVISFYGASPATIQGEVMRASASTYEPPCSAVHKTAKNGK